MSKQLIDRILIANEKFAQLSPEAKQDLIADIQNIEFRDDHHFNTYLERKEKTFGELKTTVITKRDDEKNTTATSDQIEEIFKNMN